MIVISHPSQITLRIILNGLKKEVKEHLAEEQVGFKTRTQHSDFFFRSPKFHHFVWLLYRGTTNLNYTRVSALIGIQALSLSLDYITKFPLLPLYFVDYVSVVSVLK